MSVLTTIPFSNERGNGSTTTFYFNFLVNKASELVVFLNGDESNPLIYGTDYSIHEFGNADGSNITFPLSGSKYSILTDQDVISMVSSLPIKQESSFSAVPVLEKTLDYIVRCLQIVNRQVERSVKTKEGSGVDPDVLISNLETSATNAASSATAAATAATNASNSATTAGTSATAAANSAAQAAIYAQQLQQSSVTYTATIGTNWNGTSAPFTQDVAVSGILATDNAVVGLVQSDTFATAQIQRQEYSKIFRAVSSTDKVTFYANAPTTSVIAVQLKIVR